VAVTAVGRVRSVELASAFAVSQAFRMDWTIGNRIRLIGRQPPASVPGVILAQKPIWCLGPRSPANTPSGTSCSIAYTVVPANALTALRGCQSFRSTARADQMA
jgi:hypothetical protein